ncbi:hypothetical protein V6N11_027242 [Hibiscus sabdariffa]|uniref:Uncharacterized protein n=1 Tax=Hibiscus sabdariffa TaxID=183260 RepID=A0ABR2PGG5_9ROSI
MFDSSRNASEKTAARSSSLPTSKFSSQPLNLVPGAILKSGRNEETHQALDDTVTTPSTLPNEHHNTSCMSNSSLRASSSILDDSHASIQSPIQPVTTLLEFSGCDVFEQPTGACVSEQPVLTASESPGCAAFEQAAGACIPEQHVLNPSTLHEEPNGQSHSIQDDGEYADISAHLSYDALNVHPMLLHYSLFSKAGEGRSRVDVEAGSSRSHLFFSTESVGLLEVVEAR